MLTNKFNPSYILIMIKYADVLKFRILNHHMFTYQFKFHNLHEVFQNIVWHIQHPPKT